MFVYFKIVKIVVSRQGPFSAIDKCTMIFIAAVPIGFQICQSKNKEALLKHLKRDLRGWGAGEIF